MSDEQRYTIHDVRDAFRAGANAALANPSPFGWLDPMDAMYPLPTQVDLRRAHMVWDASVLRAREHADVRTCAAASVLYDKAFG